MKSGPFFFGIRALSLRLGTDNPGLVIAEQRFVILWLGPGIGIAFQLRNAKGHGYTDSFLAQHSGTWGWLGIGDSYRAAGWATFIYRKMR